MNSREILSRVLKEDEEHRRAAGVPADGAHLSDEDFKMLLADETAERLKNGREIGGRSSQKLPARQAHLASCDLCLENFSDYYAFFAPAAPAETVAGKAEIDSAWQSFAPRIAADNPPPVKRSWKNLIFPQNESTGGFFSSGWAFAAVCLLIAGIALTAWWKSQSQNSQLVAELEREKIEAQKRLETIPTGSPNQIAEPSAPALSPEEKSALENQIAELEQQLARIKREKSVEKNEPPKSPDFANRDLAAARNPISPPPVKGASDDRSVSVNTPIYDVFPADSNVRSGNQKGTVLRVPRGAQTVVLILNAAGQTDKQDVRVVLTNAAGKVLRRGGTLRKDATGNFTLSLSGALLKSGGYRLQLISGNETFADYPFTIAPE